MATFCGGCGAAWVEGNGFCAVCGRAAAPGGSAPAAPAAVVAGGSAMAATATPAASSGLTMNLAAALAYALGLITGVLFLVLDPYRHDRLVRFHAVQSVVLSLAVIVFAIAWNIVWSILASLLGFWVLAVDLPLRLAISLGIFGLWLYVMFQAYGGREYRIPFLGQIAARHGR
ncbi:MAG: DUF4870 domain-containing protein [Terriglobales bacterium]